MRALTVLRLTLRPLLPTSPEGCSICSYAVPTILFSLYLEQYLNTLVFHMYWEGQNYLRQDKTITLEQPTHEGHPFCPHLLTAGEHPRLLQCLLPPLLVHSPPMGTIPSVHTCSRLESAQGSCGACSHPPLTYA